MAATVHAKEKPKDEKKSTEIKTSDSSEVSEYPEWDSYSGFKLPSEEELNYPDITVSYAALKAAGFHLGQYCLKESREFMLCRHEEQDPRKCLKEGRDVTDCGLEFFYAIKANCYNEFEKYWRCIHHSGRNQDFYRCRPTQDVYDQCVSDKLNIERPPVGYYSKAHIYDSDRPQPKTIYKIFPDQSRGMPKEYDKPDAWRGNRSPLGL